jgi:hypothetical protein
MRILALLGAAALLSLTGCQGGGDDDDGDEVQRAARRR